MKKRKTSFKFSEGDKISVKSKDKILRSIDHFNKLERCLFMNQMWEYCGKKFKIIKVVKNFFDECRYKMYKTHSPLYILDNIVCSGIVKGLDQRCDRSCYLLWHEEWLERIADNLND